MTNNTETLQKVVTFSEPTTSDGSDMWDLVNQSTLDQNSPYKYIMMCEFFSDTCVVAKEEDKLVGFITGFIPPNRPDVIFIWQVGVHESQRGKGIASKMLNDLLSRVKCKNIRFLEATVTPTNVASQSLFLRLARDHNTECKVDDFFSEDLFPEEGKHEAELMYRVGPLTK
ncbi:MULTISPECIES: diaminobutyrate acetyltransferase [Bacillaceae]|uniref:L-2,4-diaminobutyric acid acetyltransferase n=1 Tax=Evansella alkalicola TaxID=745819 RepID=A0ABS6JU73_9BACI|nr:MULTISPECIES: diaminobutyrate acetyltransferase [Bacillaceae]MBU9722043.1 diaminobutyrate acetyltransferase [Bacillus alkalicola]